MSPEEKDDNTEVRQRKDAVIAEILIAYQQAAIVCRKSQNTKFRDSISAMRHGFDMLLERLFPLNEGHEKILAEIRAKFIE